MGQRLGDFFESVGKDVDPLISEISVMKQLIKERAQPLDLVRELLSNSGAGGWSLGDSYQLLREPGRARIRG